MPTADVTGCELGRSPLESYPGCRGSCCYLHVKSLFRSLFLCLIFMHACMSVWLCYVICCGVQIVTIVLFNINDSSRYCQLIIGVNSYGLGFCEIWLIGFFPFLPPYLVWMQQLCSSGVTRNKGAPGQNIQASPSPFFPISFPSHSL